MTNKENGNQNNNESQNNNENQKNNENQNNNEIKLVYNTNNKDSIKIFGSTFVRNNKDKTKIIYKNK